MPSSVQSQGAVTVSPVAPANHHEDVPTAPRTVEVCDSSYCTSHCQSSTESSDIVNVTWSVAPVAGTLPPPSQPDAAKRVPPVGAEGPAEAFTTAPEAIACVP
ncbi:MAG: hypothetical protein BWY59_00890 [Verrucomicrobia bacterium ADurb.Bin345]|nr:MAG: hypothetical protein BWY59_00890 [Verrucomicrobia bacterium ADurb.Bin345]